MGSSRNEIRQLPSLCLKAWECPKKPWSFEPVRQQQRRQRQGSAAGARPGQAVLQLPLMHADVSVHLPPGIEFSATPAGLLDCRLQLLSISADWPASRGSGSPHSSGARVLPATSPTLGFVQRCAALLLAQALFPERTTNLLGWLAVPLALADGAALVAAATPPAVRHAAGQGADRLKARLQGHGPQRSGNAAGGVGWLDTLGGVAAGSLHTIRCLSGPAATLATAGWLWGLLHPDSHALCSCMVALAAVAAEYSQLSNDVSRGKIRPGRPAEAAWRACHKAAAQRLSGFLGDLPASPPLQPFLQAAKCCSIAAGLAVDGQGLCGDARQPWGSLPTAGSGSGGRGGAQLLLTGSVCAPAGAAASSLDEASGLSRPQLLELFIGCADEPSSQQQAGSGSACRITELDSSSVAQQPGAAPAVQAQMLPQQREQQLKPHGGAAERPERPIVRVMSGDGSPPPSISDLDSSSSNSSGRDGWKQPAAAAPGEVAAAEPVCCRGSKSSSSSGGVPAAQAAAAAAAGKEGQHDKEDVLAFLEELPLYGQQDHKGALAAASGIEPDAQDTGLRVRLQLCLRALYLLLVFAPFLLLGAPMLLMAWHLLGKAEQQQDKPMEPEQPGDGAAVAVVTPRLPDDNSSRPSSWRAAGAGVTHAARQPLRLLLQLLVQLGLLLGLLFDVLLILLLGGHWAAGLDPHVSARLFLRHKAWQLLLFSCSNAGAAFIKWGQWSSSRRDIFPEDFCDTFSRLHDKAPVHSFRWTRRLVQEALGAKLEDLFESFDHKPLASGSIAQVHKATLRSNRHLHLPGCAVEVLPPAASDADASGNSGSSSNQRPDEPLVVAVKVCHPNVAAHIRLDFRLLTALSEAASRLPALRGLSIRQSVAQFSHTMTAQTDLRVEAVHALRFYNNFAGVRSAICVPRPIPGLVSEKVLVETYEPGQSVATFMQQPSPLNTHIVALGVDAFLHMLLKDNWIHSDLHPGNILFRQMEQQPRAPSRLEQQRQQQQQQQGQESGKAQGPLRGLFRLLRQQRSADQADGSGIAGEAAAAAAAAAPAQWELELQQMISQQQQSWNQRHGAAAGSAAQPAAAAAAAALDDDDSAAAAAGAGAAHLAQLVLLDFGLAEELTPEVRHHFVSFLNAIAAGDGLAAARHLLRWSRRQTCDDRPGFTRDVMDLFERCADIQSPAGIDLDVVMKGCLSLARKHGVSIDSQYASLVISVCVLVGFGKALDPAVNLMDAATPTLLAYQTTGRIIGRLYS